MLVTEGSQLDDILKSVQRSTHIGMDLEWHGPLIQPNIRKKKTFPDPARSLITGYSVATADGSWYVPLRHNEWNALSGAYGVLQRLVGGEHNAVVWWHNFKADYNALTVEVFTVAGDHRCSMLAAWMLNKRAEGKKPLSLKPLAEQYLGVKDAQRFEDATQGKAANEVAPEVMAPYAAADAEYTRYLGLLWWPLIEKYDLKDSFLNLEMPFVRCVRHMERAGCRIDSGYLRTASVDLEAQCEQLALEFEMLTTLVVDTPIKVKEWAGDYFKNGNKRFKTVERTEPKAAGASISSSKQVSTWLYELLGWWPKPPKRMKGGNYPTDHDTLSDIAGNADVCALGREAAQLRLDYQERAKLASTYTTFPAQAEQYEDDRLHGDILQAGTVTQRLAMRNPNLQNLPRPRPGLPEIRRAFIPREGWTAVVADYSQLELRLMAHFSRDKSMVQIYQEGGDIHANTMEAMGIKERVPAKTTNFSTIYRITAKNLAKRITHQGGRPTTMAEAQAFIKGFYKAYPRVAWYQDQAIAFAKKNGYAPSITGFKRFMKIDARGRHYFENCAINTPIQSSAGGLMKVAMLNLHTLWQDRGWLGKRVNMLVQVHDELYVEADPQWSDTVADDMKRVMEGVGPTYKLRVPLVVEPGVGSSWLEAK